MGNRKRARAQNSSPEAELVENKQDNVQKLHPLLINVIVRHVMTFLDLADIRKFRGVNRLWNEEAIGLLRELKKPLFYLRLNATSYIEENRYLERRPLGEKKVLLNLSKIVGLAGSGSWPPISLHIDICYDEKSAGQVRKNLSWIFENHASDLVKLIVLSGDNSLEIPIPVETTIPLKNLMLDYYDELCLHHSATFLAACTELQKLEIDVFSGIGPDLQFPDSLTTLKLSLPYGSNVLVVLAKKSLPNLTKLSVRVNDITFDNGTLYKLLDNFRANLKYLHISGKYYGRDPAEPLEEYRFPVMDNLEELKFVNFFQPLEANINNLPFYLPKLKKLSLINLNESCAEKWLSGHRLETVTSLQINWVEERDWGKFRSTDQEMVARVCTTFPNLTNLSLAFSGEDVSGLLTVFEKMQQLEKLTIYYTSVKKIIRGLGSVLLKPSAKKELQSKKEESDFSRMKNQNVTYSLNNLTKLKMLCIALLTDFREYFYRCEDDDEGEDCADDEDDKRYCITDALFTQTFLKMDSLRCLSLGPELMPSEPVASTWRSVRSRTLKLHKTESHWHKIH